MNTNNSTQEKYHFYDIIKWILVIFFLITAIISNYFFKNYSTIIRISLVIGILSLAIIIGLWTTKGKSVLVFTKEAHMELKKVFWSSHNETLQMTLIIAAVTIIISLILWGLDTVLIHAVSFIINLRF